MLREQGCQIAARTYRDWAAANRPVAARTRSDAQVMNQVRDLAWTVDHEGVRRMAPKGSTVAGRWQRWCDAPTPVLRRERWIGR